jgi:dipeptidyl aminopeptidase/acylaminoacyl peptidase
MTERMGLERDLAAYFDARSTRSAPAGLLEATLVGVGQTRQRRAWRFIGRRIADRRTSRWAVPGSARLVLAVVGLLVALVIGAIVIAGTQRRLPPPFGPAKPGLLAVDIGGHIGLMKADGTGLGLLPSAPEVHHFPIWSPDGTKIAFVASRDLALALVVTDADGRNSVTLADHLHGAVAVRDDNFGSLIPMSWSPDSQFIVFTAYFVDDPPVVTPGDVQPSKLYVARVDRPGAERIGRADLYGVSPSWSPDGRVIAFRHADAGQPEGVWVIRPDGESLAKLSDSTPVRDVFSDGAWAPDGKRLAFLAEGVNHSSDVYVINADGSGQLDITNTPEGEEWARWSPDGTRLVVSSFDFGSFGSTGSTFVINPDGSNRLDIPTAGHFVSTPAWSPDGSRILGYFDGGITNTKSDGLVVLDPSGHEGPKFIPEPAFGSVTWQRLAP